jgi:4-alpha-glucanotransferase
VRFGELDRFHSGVAVPLASLRSREQFGIGEFADLPAFGEWAAACGFDLVQILPVQDTGADSSPYAARSAIALHPIHLRLQEIEGSDAFSDAIRRESDAFRSARAIDYAAVRVAKRAWLDKIFASQDPDRLWREAKAWVAVNPWIRPHAVFCVLAERHPELGWSQWPELRDPTEADIDRFWAEASTELLFHVWIQQNADAQLTRASRSLDAMGIRLKGDLPILCDENSSDVWYHRRYFDLAQRAGAPPDMYSESGQLWGFPCYRWNALAEDDYAWWMRRLASASRYYHALRIDHVLGFFRIWQVPSTSRTGMLGHFDPSVAIHRATLLAAGFSHERIDSLAAPDGRANERFPTEAEYEGVEDEQERLALMRRLWNRVLLDPKGEGTHFYPFWHWYESPLFLSLEEHEKRALGEIIGESARQQDELWERTGRARLDMIDHATDSLVCAEDLGAVPPSVPRVLADLGILGLRVERWCRNWDAEGQPYEAPSSFPRQTVCSPGVHDASSLRAWWEEESTGRDAYWSAMGKEGPAPDRMDEGLLREVLERNLAADSALCILALADCLALESELRPADPREERVNVPGTASVKNWHWRMPLDIEDLLDRAPLASDLAAMNERRRQRPF